MKKMIIALFAVLMVPAIALGWGENNIGLYTVETPTGADEEATLIATAAGGHTIYMVLSNPWNENLGQPIVNLSGFECSISDLPTGWSIATVTLPDGVLDLHNGMNDFYCSGSFPAAVGNDIVLASLLIGTYDAAPVGGYVYIMPNFVAPSIPGSMAVTDADDEHSISRAFPSSGNYDMPVFGINMGVVPSEDASWGSVKSMFK